MHPSEFHQHLLTLLRADDAPWWVFAAMQAHQAGREHLIPSRDGTSLYMARWALTPPAPAVEGSSGPFDSGECVLLHYFLRGDDDGALHDHPWNFWTHVLAGGHTERRPNADWRWMHDIHGTQMGATLPGPKFDECELLVRHAGGPRVQRQATDLHAVEEVIPGTWTMVVTGDRYRDWGFHPPGQPWVQWRTFLEEKRAATAAGV